MKEEEMILYVKITIQWNDIEEEINEKYYEMKKY